MKHSVGMSGRIDGGMKKVAASLLRPFLKETTINKILYNKAKLDFTSILAMTCKSVTIISSNSPTLLVSIMAKQHIKGKKCIIFYKKK